MKRKLFLLCLAALSLCLSHPTRAQDNKGAAAPLPVNHGGKIETRYDGVARETVVALKRMQVTCGSAKGLQSTLKGVCVSL